MYSSTPQTQFTIDRWHDFFITNTDSLGYRAQESSMAGGREDNDLLSDNLQLYAGAMAIYGGDNVRAILSELSGIILSEIQTLCVETDLPLSQWINTHKNILKKIFFVNEHLSPSDRSIFVEASQRLGSIDDSDFGKLSKAWRNFNVKEAVGSYQAYFLSEGNLAQKLAAAWLLVKAQSKTVWLENGIETSNYSLAFMELRDQLSDIRRAHNFDLINRSWPEQGTYLQERIDRPSCLLGTTGRVANIVRRCKGFTDTALLKPEDIVFDFAWHAIKTGFQRCLNAYNTTEDKYQFLESLRVPEREKLLNPAVSDRRETVLQRMRRNPREGLAIKVLCDEFLIQTQGNGNYERFYIKPEYLWLIVDSIVRQYPNMSQDQNLQYQNYNNYGCQNMSIADDRRSNPNIWHEHYAHTLWYIKLLNLFLYPSKRKNIYLNMVGFVRSQDTAFLARSLDIKGKFKSILLEAKDSDDFVDMTSEAFKASTMNTLGQEFPGQIDVTQINDGYQRFFDELLFDQYFERAQGILFLANTHGSVSVGDFQKNAMKQALGAMLQNFGSLSSEEQDNRIQSSLRTMRALQQSRVSVLDQGGDDNHGNPIAVANRYFNQQFPSGVSPEQEAQAVTTLLLSLDDEVIALDSLHHPAGWDPDDYELSAQALLYREAYWTQYLSRLEALYTQRVLMQDVQGMSLHEAGAAGVLVVPPRPVVIDPQREAEALAALETFRDQPLIQHQARTGYYNLSNVTLTGPRAGGAGPYPTLYMPRGIPIVTPYNPLGDTPEQIRINHGIPHFNLTMSLPHGSAGNLPPGVIELLAQYNIGLNQLDVCVSGQTMPWQNDPLLLRVNSWAHPYAPAAAPAGGYNQTSHLLVAVQDINSHFEQLAPVDVHTHSVDANIHSSVVYSPQNAHITGIEDQNHTHMFYSLCIDEQNRKAVLTAHILLNDQDNDVLTAIMLDANELTPETLFLNMSMMDNTRLTELVHRGITPSEALYGLLHGNYPKERIPQETESRHQLAEQLALPRVVRMVPDYDDMGAFSEPDYDDMGEFSEPDYDDMGEAERWAVPGGHLLGAEDDSEDEGVGRDLLLDFRNRRSRITPGLDENGVLPAPPGRQRHP